MRSENPEDLCQNEDRPLPPAGPAESQRPGRGRPRVWASAGDRNQAAGQRRTERQRLLNELLEAMLNAAWDEPELQRTINRGEEQEVLRAFIEYYRRRHWTRGGR